MYSDNDFRYYKGGSYLAHYGVKGMKWHKHLKAATNWWDENVSGSTAKKDMKRAQGLYSKYSYRIPVLNDSFKTKAKGGKEVRTNKRTLDSYMRETYNKENLAAKKKYDKSLRGKAENKLRIGARTAEKTVKKIKRLPDAIDKNITGSSARNNIRYHDQNYRIEQRDAAGKTHSAAIFQKHGSQRSADELRRSAARSNKYAVDNLNKRNKAQEEYDKSLRGKAEKKVTSFFKKRKQKKANSNYLSRRQNGLTRFYKVKSSYSKD